MRLGSASGHARAHLDGFKARVLREQGLPSTERRWLYEIEWSCVREGVRSAVAMTVQQARFLVVGDGVPRLLANVLSDAGYSVADGRRTDGLEGLQAVILATSMAQGGAAAQTNELDAISVALELLQAQAAARSAPSVWICTRGMLAGRSDASGGAPLAGLWGLGRACRQEVPATPAWCLDFEGDSTQADQSFVGLMASGRLQLSAGVVRGLHLSSSVEPEAAWRTSAWHTPRLVAPYDTRPAPFIAAFTSIRDGLNAHTDRAMAALDTEKLSRAYVLLEWLCQQ